MTLATGTGYTLTNPTSASGSIVDNDTAVVTVTATDTTAAEQGRDPAVFTVIARRQHGERSLVVNLSWGGTATRGTDYTISAIGGDAVGERPPADARGRASASATITLTPIDDALVEGVETATLGDRRTAPATPSARRRARASRSPTTTRCRRSSSAWPTRPAPSRAPTRSSSRSRGRTASTQIVVNLTWSGTATYRRRLHGHGDAAATLSADGLQLTLGRRRDERVDLRDADRRHGVRADRERDADARRSAPATRSAARRPRAARSSTTTRAVVTSTRPTRPAASRAPTRSRSRSRARGASRPTIVVALGWSGTATRGTDYTLTASGGTLAAERPVDHARGRARRARRSPRRRSTTRRSRAPRR